ncbi:putative membrane protein [Clostridium botulinum C str. Eklund]|nr:putative membrane protein [Clostridium botulinum C str. Eklund]NEZ48208.1 ABC transporter permease [Clostridium botulinum]
MTKLLKLSFLNTKNVVRSKQFIVFIIAAFAYSLAFFMATSSRNIKLQSYSNEFGRFLFVVILYASVSILRGDIISNTTKTIFTGIFTRIEVMFSKLISLIFLGFIFYLIVEVDALFIGLLDYKRMGLQKFLEMQHGQIMIIYIVITFSVGTLMFLINSIILKKGKNILFAIVTLTAINFNNAFIVTLSHRSSVFAEKIWIYAKTPFYIWTDLSLRSFTEVLNIEQLLMCIVYGLVFFGFATFIISKREI